MSTSNAERTQEFVSVMVPVDRVIDVYTFLANVTPKILDRQIDSPTTNETGDFQQHFRLPESRNWPEPLLQRAYRESSPAMKAVLDVLIENAGKIVHSQELVAAIATQRRKPCDHHTLAGTIGAFGRRVANRYKRRDWPMYSFWDGAANEVQYRMSSEVAAQMRP